MIRKTHVKINKYIKIKQTKNMTTTNNKMTFLYLKRVSNVN